MISGNGARVLRVTAATSSARAIDAAPGTQYLGLAKRSARSAGNSSGGKNAEKKYTKA